MGQVSLETYCKWTKEKWEDFFPGEEFFPLFKNIFFFFKELLLVFKKKKQQNPKDGNCEEVGEMFLVVFEKRKHSCSCTGFTCIATD